MGLTEKNSPVEAMRAVQIVVEQQVSGRVSVTKAVEQWRKILQQFPTESVAEALAVELAIGKYQHVPTCACCGR